MYSLSDLTEEIGRTIEGFDSQNVRAISPDLITDEVLSTWGEISGACADRFVCTAHAFVRNQVRQKINRYKIAAELEPDMQLVMEGFDRLQKRYLIEENGEHVAVRVQDMTSEQRMARAEELRAMGAGCFQHAAELERYNRSVAA